jgi:hypothetical protein
MYYAELQDKSLKLAFGKDVVDAVKWCLEQWGEELEAVYKDNLNDPFIKIWEREQNEHS